MMHVPRQAVFDKNGKNHVFVKTGDRFEQREVKVEQRTESRLAIRSAGRYRDCPHRPDGTPGNTQRPPRRLCLPRRTR